jgi:hypothetical protein
MEKKNGKLNASLIHAFITRSYNIKLCGRIIPLMIPGILPPTLTTLLKFDRLFTDNILRN